MNMDGQTRIRLRLDAIVGAFCLCGKHPRFLSVYDLVESWKKGRAALEKSPLL